MKLWGLLYGITPLIPPSFLGRWQDFRLKGILKKAGAIPFWENKLGVSGKTIYRPLELISPISKQIIKESRLPCAKNNLHPSQYWENQTSGSTGIPFSFFRDTNEWPEQWALFLRALGWAGKKPGDSVLKTFGSHHPLGDYWGVFPYDNPSELQENLPHFYKYLDRHKTWVFYSFPSFIIPLADFWEKNRPNAAIRAIVAAGEDLTFSTRARLQRIFRAPIFLAYAAREFGIIAQECSQHNGLHIFAENLVVEVTNSEGKRLPPGASGAILITSLSNKVMPFIRYAIGDVGKFLTGPCPCGLKLPRIKIEGRQTAILTSGSGRQIYLVEIQRLITEKVGNIVREFQLYQQDLKHLSLLIVPGEGFSELAGRDLLKLLKPLVHPANLKLEVVPKVPLRNKRKLAFYSELLTH